MEISTEFVYNTSTMAGLFRQLIGKKVDCGVVVKIGDETGFVIIAKDGDASLGYVVTEAPALLPKFIAEATPVFEKYLGPVTLPKFLLYKDGKLLMIVGQHTLPINWTFPLSEVGIYRMLSQLGGIYETSGNTLELEETALLEAETNFIALGILNNGIFNLPVVNVTKARILAAFLFPNVKGIFIAKFDSTRKNDTVHIFVNRELMAVTYSYPKKAWVSLSLKGAEARKHRYGANLFDKILGHADEDEGVVTHGSKE
jgi:hypothetical protein